MAIELALPSHQLVVAAAVKVQHGFMVSLGDRGGHRRVSLKREVKDVGEIDGRCGCIHDTRLGADLHVGSLSVHHL